MHAACRSNVEKCPFIKAIESDDQSAQNKYAYVQYSATSSYACYYYSRL